MSQVKSSVNLCGYLEPPGQVECAAPVGRDATARPRAQLLACSGRCLHQGLHKSLCFVLSFVTVVVAGFGAHGARSYAGGWRAMSRATSIAGVRPLGCLLARVRAHSPVAWCGRAQRSAGRMARALRGAGANHGAGHGSARSACASALGGQAEGGADGYLCTRPDDGDRQRPESARFVALSPGGDLAGK